MTGEALRFDAPITGAPVGLALAVNVRHQDGLGLHVMVPVVPIRPYG